jgi:hypothetical protein
MTVNRVTMDKQELVFCNTCYYNLKLSKRTSRKLWENTWERYPEKDLVSLNGKIMEFAYRCRNCGDITFYPYEPPNFTAATATNQA